MAEAHSIGFLRLCFKTSEAEALLVHSPAETLPSDGGALEPRQPALDGALVVAALVRGQRQAAFCFPCYPPVEISGKNETGW